MYALLTSEMIHARFIHLECKQRVKQAHCLQILMICFYFLGRDISSSDPSNRSPSCSDRNAIIERWRKSTSTAQQVGRQAIFHRFVLPVASLKLMSSN